MSAIGIDLGTTYSSVAVKAKNGQIEVIANDQGHRATPSVVFFPEPDRSLVGHAAKVELARDTKNTIFGIKRIIGRSFKDPTVQIQIKKWEFDVLENQGKTQIGVMGNDTMKLYYPEQISSMVLSQMKKIAEVYIGEKVSSAVITVPAHFNNAQRSATNDAARIARLHVLAMINEPTAAAIAYGLQQQITKKRNILVYDFGGGTFDVTLMTIEGGDYDVKATAGNTNLGGEDITDRILKYCVVELQKKAKKEFQMNSKKKQKLRTECEEAKYLLSGDGCTRASISIETGGEDLDCFITRATFEHINKDIFDQTLDLVKQVLVDAEMDKTKVDEVVLVGGSSRIPRVYEMLADYFGKDKVRTTINPELAVALGAGTHAAFLSGDVTPQMAQMNLRDVTPLSLGISVGDGKMSMIINRNTKIPAKKTKSFQTSIDNQKTASLQVYEGESGKCKENNLLGKFKLTGIPPKPAGTVEIEVFYQIDSNGVLNVSAIEKEAGKNQSIRIVMDSGRMTEAETNRLLNENEKQRRKNEEWKTRIKALNDLESHVHNVRSKMKSSESAGWMNRLLLETECIDTERWIKQNEGASTDEIGIRKAKLDAVAIKCFR